MSFWLDDRWLLNHSVVPVQSTTASCTIELSSDQIYDLEIRYFSIGAPTAMTIDWIYSSRPLSRVPSEYLYSSKIPQKQVNVTFVSNSTACATRSRAFGSGLSLMTAGKVAKFSIALKDHLGHNVALSSRSGIRSLEFKETYSAHFAEGSRFSVMPVSTSGRGSGATFSIKVDATKHLTVKVIIQGQNYAVGDTVTFTTANTAIGGASAPEITRRIEETGSDFEYVIEPMPVSVRWMLSDNSCSTPNQCRFSKGTVTVAGPSEYQVTLRAPKTTSMVFYDRFRAIPSLFAVDLL
jgi:hypothetical protein